MNNISKILAATSAAILAAASCGNRPTGEFQFDLLTTNDVHGAWFDSTYVDGPRRTSLMAVNTYVNAYRDSLGIDNVILSMPATACRATMRLTIIIMWTLSHRTFFRALRLT